MRSGGIPNIGIRSRIRDLRGESRSFAEEIAEELSENYGFRVSGNNSIYSLVTLSKKLNRRSKKDKRLLEKMEKLETLCASAEERMKNIPQEVSDRETRAKEGPRTRRREALVESLIEKEQKKRIPASELLYEDKSKGIVIRKATSSLMDDPEKKGELFELFRRTMDPRSAKEMAEHFSDFASGKSRGGLFEPEYYILEIKGKAAGYSGISTIKPQTPGFGEHGDSFVVARLGWLGVSSEHRGKGLGRLLVEKAEERARSLGADIFAVETSNNPIYDGANNLYLSMGYRSGLDQKGYFGQGRDLHTVFANTGEIRAEAKGNYSLEKITQAEASEALELARKISPGEAGEFARLLDLHLSQPQDSPLQIFALKKEGELVGLATASTYPWATADAWWSRWHGATKGNEKALFAHLNEEAKRTGKRMLVVETSSAKERESLISSGFSTGKTIPSLYCSHKVWKEIAKSELDAGQITAAKYKEAVAKPLEFLFYSKPLSERANKAAAEFGLEKGAQKKIPATISPINLSAVANGDKEETEKFRKAVNFLMEYFPANERVPFENFMEAATQGLKGKYGDDPGNRYSLIVATDASGEIVGAHSAIYLNKAAAGFTGFVRISGHMQGGGLGRAIMDKGISFFKKAARENGKELKYSCGEVEHLWAAPDKGEVVKRREAFIRMGFTEVDPRTGFRYFQPDEGKGTPLTLMLTAIDRRRTISREDLLGLTRSIYGTIYPNIGEADRKRFLAQTAESVKMDVVPLMPVATGKPGGRTENEELDLKKAAQYVGNDPEFQRTLRASEAADKFFEMRDPKDKAVFDSKNARRLYEYLFPNKDEAESWKDDILPRIKEMGGLADSEELQQKYGDSRFHAIVATSGKDVIGYTQFSTMPLEDGGVVAFWQYGGVSDGKFMKKVYKREETFREEGVGSAFYAFRHQIADQDAKEMGRTGVVGTILEAEMIGQAETPDDMRFTKTRLHIHRQMGAKAIMLEMEDGSLITAHLQPKLSEDSNPILLHMLFRPVNFDQKEMGRTTEMDKGLARSLVMSYIDNFDREGFDEKDVDYARKTLQERFAKAKRVLLMPPEQLPNIVEMAKTDPLLREQAERDYGALDAHEKKIKKALSEPASPDARRLGS